MCDQVRLLFPIKPGMVQEVRASSLPLAAANFVNLSVLADGRLKSRPNKIAGKGLSPESRGFSVECSRDSAGALTGYLLKMSIGSVLLGNNAVLTNGVYAACLCAKLQFLNFLYELDVRAEDLKLIDFSKVSLHFVSLTYLIKFLAPEDARKFCHSLIPAGEIRNSEARLNNAERCNHFGTSERSTVYIHERTHEIRGYWKGGVNMRCNFANSHLETIVTAAAELNGRLELDLFYSKLKALGLDDPAAWEMKGGNDPYRSLFPMIREAFRLDDGLKERAPQERHLACLDNKYREYLKAHLNGEDISNRPEFKKVPSNSQEQKTLNIKCSQKFSRAKQGLLKSVGIDLTVPWAVQQRAVKTRVGDFIKYPGLYRPDDSIADHIFCPASATIAYNALWDGLPSSFQEYTHPDRANFSYPPEQEVISPAQATAWGSGLRRRHTQNARSVGVKSAKRSTPSPGLLKPDDQAFRWGISKIRLPISSPDWE